ncbi:MAG: hypothetical protein KDD92_03335 [Caldilineaceae bacterium]|nr:hypothetical protein [Caldilineaceae bacterium]
MLESQEFPSYIESVADILSSAPAPMTFSSIMSAVEKSQMLHRDTRSSVYRAISKLYQAVEVEPGRYGWLTTLLQGVHVRHPLTADEVRRGYLMLDELEHAVFCPEFFQSQQQEHQTLTIELLGGPAIQARTHVERRTWSLYLGKTFVQWLDSQGGQERDDAIISVLDAEEGRYSLRLQPREAKIRQAVRDRNIQIALAAEDIATADQRVRPYLPAWDLVARLVASGHLYDLTPPDDLHYVMDQYSMLHYVEGEGYTLSAPKSALSGDGRISRGERRSDTEDFYSEEPFDVGSAPWEDDLLDLDDVSLPGFREAMDPVEFLGDLDDQFGESCGAYELYLSQYEEADHPAPPLGHAEFHMLEAELEYLIALEVEFNGLLPEQEARKEELASRLFIDPDAWPNDDFDIPDYPDYEDPPYWGN